MNALSFAQQHLGSIDDSTLSVLVMLVGIIAGYRLTGWHQQLKAKRAKVTRRAPITNRKPD